MKVGIGITTYDRPKYLTQCLEGVKTHLKADSVWIYNDGSTKSYKDVDRRGYNYHHSLENKGVAAAKNWLLKQLIEEGCDYLFLMEDDIIILSPKAVTEYIRLSKKSGIEHFNFAHHGEANKGKLKHRENGIDIYGNPVGAWSMYTRRVIEECGYMDENFVNAWEHIEHTHRIAKAGYTTPWPYACADLTHSKKYLKEIPGSIDNSSIRPQKSWLDNVINGLIYWKETREDFPLNHILESLLEEEKELVNASN